MAIGALITGVLATSFDYFFMKYALVFANLGMIAISMLIFRAERGRSFAIDL